MRFRLGLFFLFLLVLSGCRAVEDPRALASKQIKIEINENGCKPVELIVPNGEKIQVEIDNQTLVGYTWYILFFDLEGEFDPLDTDNIIATISAPGQSKTNGEFFSPKITAKYMTVCALDSNPNQVELINLLVVEPYEK
jgi:PBP1b-binding outer membrane lipoprotein LpoB